MATVRPPNGRTEECGKQYDATLLSYYLARSEGVVLRSEALSRQGGELRVEGLAETLVPLVETHAPNQDPDQVALARLREQTRDGAVLVVSRSSLRLPELDRVLSRCELVRDAARARLVRCRPRGRSRARFEVILDHATHVARHVAALHLGEIRSDDRVQDLGAKN